MDFNCVGKYTKNQGFHGMWFLAFPLKQILKLGSKPTLKSHLMWQTVDYYPIISGSVGQFSKSAKL